MLLNLILYNRSFDCSYLTIYNGIFLDDTFCVQSVEKLEDSLQSSIGGGRLQCEFLKNVVLAFLIL